MVEKKLPEKDGYTMDRQEALLRGATYLKWWRDGAIAEADVPDDIGEIIVALEQSAEQFEREPTDA